MKFTIFYLNMGTIYIDQSDRKLGVDLLLDYKDRIYKILVGAGLNDWLRKMRNLQDELYNKSI